MEALIYFVFWALAFFLIMRLGCGAHIMGHTGNPEQLPDRTENSRLRWIPPEKDRDPVCGKTVATDKAKPSVYDGIVYYFCSRDCREQFEAAPDLYVAGATPDIARGERGNEKEPSHV